MDDYTELRAALGALDGLDFPGNWVAAGPSFGDDRPRYLNEVCTDTSDTEDGAMTVCASGDAEGETNDRILGYIGEANPATVRRLLEERDALRRQLDWTAHYADGSIKTASRDLDDWIGDMDHIAKSARAALARDTKGE